MWLILSKIRDLVRTIPCGSMSSKCFGWDSCMPVKTYCPGVPLVSRTRKSPSHFNRFSACWRVIGPWYQFSRNNSLRCTSGRIENRSEITNKISKICQIRIIKKTHVCQKRLLVWSHFSPCCFHLILDCFHYCCASYHHLHNCARPVDLSLSNCLANGLDLAPDTIKKSKLKRISFKLSLWLTVDKTLDFFKLFGVTKSGGILPGKSL